jgi:hypothetical protein
MDLKENIKKQLLILKDVGYDRAKIEKELGLAANSIDQNLARGGTQKLFTSLKLLSDNILQNSIQGQGLDSKEQVNMMRILANLSESHRNLTAAHKEISESNNKLADNEKMILSKISTADGPDSALNEASVLVPLAEILAEMATGSLHFRSKKEALAELGIRLSLHKPGRANLKRTPSGEDR